jgi:hypothetical protein
MPPHFDVAARGQKGYDPAAEVRELLARFK